MGIKVGEKFEVGGGSMDWKIIQTTIPKALNRKPHQGGTGDTHAILS